MNTSLIYFLGEIFWLAWLFGFANLLVKCMHVKYYLAHINEQPMLTEPLYLEWQNLPVGAHETAILGAGDLNLSNFETEYELPLLKIEANEIPSLKKEAESGLLNLEFELPRLKTGLA